MQYLRKIVFYIFAAIYIAVCPLLILYAFGYIYKPGTPQGVVKTGLIYLSTAPSGAFVYLNGEEKDQKTPVVLRELLAGRYTVRLSLKDYQDWDRVLPVEEEKATVLDNILLLPTQWEEEHLSENKILDILEMSGTGVLLVEEEKNEYVMFDSRNAKSWPLLGSDEKVAGEVKKVFTGGKGEYLMARVKMSGRMAYFWIVPAEGGNTVSDISELIQGVPDEIAWTENGQHLFYLSGGDIVRADVEEGALYPGYVKEVKGFTLAENVLYVLKTDNTLEQMDIDKNGQKVLLDDPDLGSSLFPGKGEYSLRVLPGEEILFVSGSGELLANKLPYRFVDSGVRGMEVCASTGRVLVWTANKVGVIDFSAEETGNVGFERGPELKWIYTAGKDIAQGFWVYEGSHVILRDGNTVSIIEVETYGDFSVDMLFSVKPKSGIYYSEDTGKICFVDQGTSELSAIQLVPQEGVMKIPFPEIKDRGKAPEQLEQDSL